MAQLPEAGYNGGEIARFGNDDRVIVPFQGQDMNGIGDYPWDQISEATESVGIDLEGLLANRGMPSGFRTAAENLRLQLSSLSQTLHDAAFRSLPRQVRRRIISPMLNAAYRNTENFYHQLRENPNLIVIEAVQAAQSGVPPSSGVIRHDQQQIPRQRREVNHINALPQPYPRQVNENPPPPPAVDITWLDHLKHVVKFCQRNWKWIALGAVAGVALGGIGGAVMSGTLLAVGAGVVGGGVGAGVGTTGVVAAVQCSRCIQGQCQDHPHQD